MHVSQVCALCWAGCWGGGLEMSFFNITPTTHPTSFVVVIRRSRRRRRVYTKRKVPIPKTPLDGLPFVCVRSKILCHKLWCKHHHHHMMCTGFTNVHTHTLVYHIRACSELHRINSQHRGIGIGEIKWKICGIFCNAKRADRLSENQFSAYGAGRGANGRARKDF